MAIGKTEGLIKVVARKDDHVIIGAQIFGHEACDLIAEMTVAWRTPYAGAGITPSIRTRR